MASVSRDPSGCYRVQYDDPRTGKRQTLRLSLRDRKTAESVRLHVEHLVHAAITGMAPPPATSAWVAGVQDPLRGRLVRAGLIDPPAEAPAVPTLGQFLNEYLGHREAEVKPSTMTVLRQAARWLLRSLDAQMPIDQVTVADADRVRAELLKGRARATANKWTRYAREFFNAALHRGHITRNPFGHIKGLAVVGSRERRVFIPAEEVRQVLAVIPCPQFRLIVALARWGGLRTPSETLALRWSDIDLPNGRMIVRASKTEHHDHGGVRIVPIFPELRPYLEELWDMTPEGAPDRVITRYTDASQNLRTQLARWCLAAGVPPWPKPFQNMRVSRATELADQFPSHVCAAWLGHTEKIADMFYRQVTDEHFRKATQNPTQKATQNPTRHTEAHGGTPRHKTTQVPAVQHDMHSTALSCTCAHTCTVGVKGFEPLTSSL